jgi:hypothetical protein
MIGQGIAKAIVNQLLKKLVDEEICVTIKVKLEKDKENKEDK